MFRIILAIALSTTLVMSRSTYVALIPNGDTLPGISAMGHINPSGGGTLNPFGLDFANAGRQWTSSLCQLDSDGDGFTNGMELGDPECVWVSGMASTGRAVSHPGDATSTPTPSCATNVSLCLSVKSVPIPSGVQVNGEYVFRYDVQGNINEPLPIYAVPTLDGGIRVAYTDSSVDWKVMSKKIQVVTLSPVDFGLVSSATTTLNASEVRGLAVPGKGDWFAILLRERPNLTYENITDPKYSPVQNMRLSKYATGSNGDTPLWTKTLEDRLPGDGFVGRIHDFGLGDGRLTFGERNEGRLAAYYKVSTGNTNNWHEGDTLKFFDSDNGNDIVTGGVGWGCSHSMEQRILFNQQLNDFGYVCASDCYPSKGIYWEMNGKAELKPLDANCGGVMKGGLGGMVSYGRNYYVVSTVPPTGGTFEANGTDVVMHIIDGVTNQILRNFSITTTSGLYETHGHIARFGGNKLLVGWRESTTKPVLGRNNVPKTYKFKIAVVTLEGVVTQVQDITSQAIFSERDDWLSMPNGDVAWVTAWNDAAPRYDYKTPNPNLRVVTISAAGLAGPSLCGNGVVDGQAGESCDDSSSCCKQCKLQYQCSPPSQCCNQMCMYEPVTTVCTTNNSAPDTLCSKLPYSGVCGSCLSGNCGPVSTQVTGNTGWCPIPAAKPCSTKVLYQGTCWDQFYKGKELIPNGTACALGGAKVCLSGACINATITYPRISAAYGIVTTQPPATNTLPPSYAPSTPTGTPYWTNSPFSTYPPSPPSSTPYWTNSP
eukprot:PhF_6_TR40803/c0_g1_i1/m.61659